MESRPPDKLLRLNQHPTKLTDIPVADRNSPSDWLPQIFRQRFLSYVQTGESLY
jgi:hypothetical protein